VDFTELLERKTELMENFDLLKKEWNSQNSQKRGYPCPPASPHLYTEHDVDGMEYFHWAAWASCLAVLPPSSCTPAH